MTTAEKIEQFYTEALANEGLWSKALISDIKADPDFKKELKAHFISKKLEPYSDRWTLYNWFMSTAFGVGINMLNKLK